MGAHCGVECCLVLGVAGSAVDTALTAPPLLSQSVYAPTLLIKPRPSNHAPQLRHILP